MGGGSYTDPKELLAYIAIQRVEDQLLLAGPDIVLCLCFDHRVAAK